MKLNIDCMRAVLLELEKVPFGEDLRINDLKLSLSDYSPDDVDYSCIMLDQAGYIDALIRSYESRSLVLLISDITFTGHQFLANIKNDNNWVKIKEKLQVVGSTSLDIVSQVAVGVATSVIRSSLGV
ncbi:MAG: DUF2513 domain-containing protein [Lachnospiraceae bacterium]|nr:DUF2513 domain-containing protein [Lachnospiraceae bacterium]